MDLNLTLYGAGIGLVMIGWMAGLVVSFLFSLNKNIGTLPNKS